MKKKTIFTCLLLCAMSITIVMADNIIRVLQVYSHGSKLTIPVANIDSLEYSRYDADSIIVEHYKTSIIRAIDSTYQIPINEVDSMVIGYLDWNEYRTQIDEIKDIITEQFGAAEEMPVEQFQTQLLFQFNNTSWIQQATINEQHDMITIQLSSGLYFLVTFRQSDYCGTEDSENESSRLLETADEEVKLFDVSYQKGEEIISSPRILCVWGRSMPSNSGYNSHSTENEEKSGLKSIVTQSPINRCLEFLNRSLDFIRDVNDYGMVIISQTHGAPSGHFQIQDLSRIYSYKPGDAIYCGGYDMKMSRQTVMKKDANLMWWVYPENCLFPNYDGIIFGNYCHSAVRANRDHKATVLGYSTVCNYYQQNDYLFPFVEKMLNGYTYQDAIDSINNTYSFRDSEDYQKYDVRMATNHLHSKLRYFSILSNDITQEDDELKLSGRINGYSNLYSSLVTRVYLAVLEGDVTPAKMRESFKHPVSQTIVNRDGSFKFDLLEKNLDLDTPYQLIVFFPFNYNKEQRYYFGNTQEYHRTICPDGHHPHLIDLGLPSGKKWACCNVDASSPCEYGGYYSWGEVEPKQIYNSATYQYKKGEYNVQYIGDDISGTDKDAATSKIHNLCMPTLENFNELNANTKKTWWQYQGVKGLLLTGNNGNSIFLPGTGYHYNESLVKAGGYQGGYYWLSTAYGDEKSTTSYAILTLNNGFNILREDRYVGLTIRPVGR